MDAAKHMAVVITKNVLPGIPIQFFFYNRTTILFLQNFRIMFFLLNQKCYNRYAHTICKR